MEGVQPLSIKNIENWARDTASSCAKKRRRWRIRSWKFRCSLKARTGRMYSRYWRTKNIRWRVSIFGSSPSFRLGDCWYRTIRQDLGLKRYISSRSTTRPISHLNDWAICNDTGFETAKLHSSPKEITRDLCTYIYWSFHTLEGHCLREL